MAVVMGQSLVVDSYDFWGKGWGLVPINNEAVLKAEGLQHQHYDCVIIGSSRAATFSPYQLEELSGAGRCMNASVGGAPNSLRRWYLDIAGTKKLKQLVYVSDFFEFFTGFQVDEIRFQSDLVKALRTYDDQLVSPGITERFLFLMDHKRWERDWSALFFLQTHTVADLIDSRLSGSGLNLADLSEPSEAPDTAKRQKVARKVHSTFEDYKRKIWTGNFSSQRLEATAQHLQKLAAEGTKITLLLSPFHPEFAQRFAQEMPELKAFYQEWQEGLQKLEHVKNIKICPAEVANFLLQGDARYWDDGVHFNKYGAARLLAECWGIE